MPVVSRVLVALGLLFAAGCAPQLDLEAERALIREADEAYTATANAGDVEGLTALYADNATRYPPDGEPSQGIHAMRAFAEGVASTPGFHMTAHPITMVVGAGADMAYTLNLIELSVTGPDDEPMVQWLRDFHLWRKGSDGTWRITEDIWHVMEVEATDAPG